MGWSVGGGGTILATTDGGSTWSPQTSGTTSILEAVTFVGPMVGWVVGSNGVILRTDDAGASWLPQTSGITDILLDVEFVDAETG